LIARVLPDVPALSSKTFDYLVPEPVRDQVRVGTVVRVELHGRRIGGWVVDVVDAASAAVDAGALKPIAKVTGWGPSADVIDLARWAAWRWAGRVTAFLGTASPDRATPRLGDWPGAERPITQSLAGPGTDLADEAWAKAPSVVRWPPGTDVFPLVLGACRLGPALVLSPSIDTATHLGLRLRRAGVPVAIMPRDWARAAAGGCAVVGARAAAWAPAPDLAAVVVLDEHDEAYAEERAPTWNARDVAVERAARAGVPFVLASPAPSLEALALADVAPLVVPSRRVERDGWPLIDVVDRRRDDPSTGLYSRRLVDLLRSGRRVVCVLNRKGRARLLACHACGELARCETCGAAVEQREDTLVCRACGTTRPVVCSACGSTRMRTLRPGVSKVREDLEALAGVPVSEVTGDGGIADAQVTVGTEAVLHRADHADAVAFLDFDQELLAPRYRAAEEAMALLVRAARVTGPRLGGGRVLVQTRLPKHEVIEGALHADASRVSAAETERRRALGYPPFAAMAVVSGEAADAFVAHLARPAGVAVVGPTDGRWLVRAPDHETLCGALAETPRPPGRLRIEVDPLRL
jgi:primosomal protein N' (replication factor Y)